MKREEAIEVMKANYPDPCFSDLRKAVDMAIKALEQSERQKGKWIANGDIPKECPFCGEDWDKYVFGDIWYTGELPKFCPNCGEDMREVSRNDEVGSRTKRIHLQ